MKCPQLYRFAKHHACCCSFFLLQFTFEGKQRNVSRKDDETRGRVHAVYPPGTEPVDQRTLNWPEMAKCTLSWQLLGRFRHPTTLFMYPQTGQKRRGIPCPCFGGRTHKIRPYLVSLYRSDLRGAGVTHSRASPLNDTRIMLPLAPRTSCPEYFFRGNCARKAAAYVPCRVLG